MINQFLNKHQKGIASILLSIFFSQISIAAYASSKYINTLPLPAIGNKFFTPVMQPAPTFIEKNALETVKAEVKNAKVNNSLEKTTTTKKTIAGPGPGQPEMQSFASVSSGNMVDLFSGDFSYNIPLLDVGGYPVNIHYRSGITMDQEASWVGLGWNINPGAITRNMRGIPDDFNGEETIEKEVSIKDNWTAGGQFGVALELFGFNAADEIIKKTGVQGTLNIGGSAFYNNYKGIGLTTNIGFGALASLGSKGALTGGIGLQASSQNGASVDANFGAILLNNNAKGGGFQSSGFSTSSSYNTRAGLQNFTVSFQGQIKQKSDAKNNKAGRPATVSGNLVNISFAHQAYTPTINIPYTSYNFSVQFRPGGEVIGMHPAASFGGFYSKQFIDKDDKKMSLPALGYMNFQKAKTLPVNTLMDYNREKELVYRANPRTPHIAIPNYTYDIFSISGEGNGGMFRPYRNDLGYIYDPEIRTKSLEGGASVDIGAGNAAHVGVDVRFNYATTKNGAWATGNLLANNATFEESDGVYEAVYFKNPAEKTVTDQEYIEKIGDTDAVMPWMNEQDDPVLTPFLQRYKDLEPIGTPLPVNEQTLKIKTKARDKRSQVISYMNAIDADKFALSKKIENYPVNSFFAGLCDASTIGKEIRYNDDDRKKHHLSEITVLNPDGKRYVYGLPVYNHQTKEVSFSVDADKDALETGLVSYNPAGENPDNSIENKKGKDHYYSSDKTPPYAHSFLLTGIVSADYVDKTGDGITDDDMGDAVKFNYSRLYGGPSNLFEWRTPYNKNEATYNEGLKTDNSDDKGSYIYGTKEIWYLNSIESKTMIATFTLNNDLDDKRLDAFGVNGENGGANDSKRLRCLRRIDLYTKSEYIEKGAAARPIKSVYFDYNYDLCQRNPSSAGLRGKLTLTKIWFTYNNNNKGEQNPYLFFYHPTDRKNNITTPNPDNNPPYHNKANDRWGLYKNAANNPAALNNGDYPYVLQDGDNTVDGEWNTQKAAVSASMWTLTDIQLPSGGSLNVEYESDDYAYVQNKRAMQMLNIVGVGNSNNYVSSTKMDNLYDRNDDYKYVFVKVPQEITAASAVDQKAEIKLKYLEDVEKLYFKLKVLMPADVYGEGYENVATYAQYEDYGLTNDRKVIWIKLKGTHKTDPGDGDASPLAKTAIQTLRLNLPSKAYPGSDLNGSYSVVAAVKAAVAMTTSLSELFKNFTNKARENGWAKQVKLEECFVRLNNASYKKYGDGLRVKRITVYDNWERMTQTKEQEATYGQEYDYTTTADINGKSVKISSGVASWEPNVGNEENPFRVPIEYMDQIAPLAPVNNLYSEFPLGEGFFPSPSVGYSKVRIRSIHYKDVKSANGFEETEYYTTKDFPTIAEQTPVEDREFNPPDILEILNFSSKRAMSFAQGFKVELNDMNGKVKRTASYSEDLPNEAFAYTEYYYKERFNGKVRQLDNTVSAITKVDGTGTRKAQIGKDVELMLDFREQESESAGSNAEFNTDGFAAGVVPVIIAALWLLPHYQLSRYRSAAAVKIVQRYGILDSVVAYDKGSKITTENILYDGETGDVLLTKTQNEFNDPVYNFTYPAHWAYSGMEPAYKNIGAIFNNVTITDGKIVSANANNIVPYLESGDELKVSGGTENGKKTNGLDCDGFGGCDTYEKIPTVTKKLWAIHSTKIQNKNGLTDGIYIIDENGKFFTGVGVTLQVLRSGKRNQQAVPVGVVTSLKDPVVATTADNFKIVFDANSKVVNSSAASFSDFWKVEDAKYKPPFITEKKSAHKKLVLNPVDGSAFSISRDYRYEPKLTFPPRPKFGLDYERFVVYAQTPYFEAAENFPPNERDDRDAYNLRSWIKFNFTDLPDNANISSAKLSLYPHRADHTETRGVPNNKLRNHDSEKPHFQGNGKANESYLHLDFNPQLQQLDAQSLTDNSQQIKDIFNHTVDPLSAMIFATAEQNSFSVQLRDLVQTIASRRDKQNTWFRLDGGGGTFNHNGHNKLCFWAQNSLSNSCDKYGPVKEGGGSYAAISARSSSVTEITPSLAKDCKACSAVGIGEGSSYCNTAPELTIEYIACEPGYSLIKECDSFYCVKTAVPEECISQVLDSTTNPYRWGILGNWRLSKNYVYYGSRTEASIADEKTDVRTMGTIANYSSYWSFTNTKLAATTSEAIWVWNTESIIFNRKGFELENKDPLDRYNSAQYGYNETMPIAVTQNSKYSEQAFDGFEDYTYKNDNCGNDCKVQNHYNKEGLKNHITDEESHSGQRSLGVPVGNSVAISVPLDKATTSLAPNLFVKVDRTVRNTLLSVANGKGLTSSLYEKYVFSEDNYGLEQYNYAVGAIATPTVKLENVIDYDSRSTGRNGSATKLGLGGGATSYKIVWEGYLTLRKNNIVDNKGNYRFAVTADDSYKMWIDDRMVLNAFPNSPQYFDNAPNKDRFSDPIPLVPGKIYKIRVEHINGGGPGYAHLHWIKPGSDKIEIVPNEVLHINEQTAKSRISFNSITCTSWQGSQAPPNILYDELKPKAGSKYVVSAWVKEQKDCKCETYENAAVRVVFRDANGAASGEQLVLKPTGNIIDGWQRIEGVISIPQNVASMDLIFDAQQQNGNQGKIFFDDWRIHPFNANMKSFVYGADNLRLLAELDENNYASFYEYDDDGTLVRVKKETERGIKTIKETRSALIKEQ